MCVIYQHPRPTQASRKGICCIDCAKNSPEPNANNAERSKYSSASSSKQTGQALARTSKALVQEISKVLYRETSTLSTAAVASWETSAMPPLTSTISTSFSCFTSSSSGSSRAANWLSTMLSFM